MDRTDTSYRPSPDGSDTELTTTEARQGETSGHLRGMLWTGLALVVVAFAIIYFLMARSW